jgi:hypothetical protein
MNYKKPIALWAGINFISAIIQMWIISLASSPKHVAWGMLALLAITTLIIQIVMVGRAWPTTTGWRKYLAGLITFVYMGLEGRKVKDIPFMIMIVMGAAIMPALMYNEYLLGNSPAANLMGNLGYVIFGAALYPVASVVMLALGRGFRWVWMTIAHQSPSK